MLSLPLLAAKEIRIQSIWALKDVSFEVVRGEVVGIPRSDLERGFYDWACFSAQQAAEKAVKAAFQKN